MAPLRLAVLVLAAAALAAGCNGGSSSSSTPATSDPPTGTTGGGTSDGSGSGACATPLQPVGKGDTWSYGVTASFGASSYRDTISAAGPSGFVITSAFPELSRLTHYRCGPDGVTGLQFGGGVAGSINAASGALVKITTGKVRGVTFPRTVSPGDTWTQSYQLAGKLRFEGDAATTRGTATLAYRALAVRPVTVPAGTFRAQVVRVVTTIRLRAVLAGEAFPSNTTFVTLAWFAPGVGMVKSDTSGNLFAIARIHAVTALRSYKVG